MPCLKAARDAAPTTTHPCLCQHLPPFLNKPRVGQPQRALLQPAATILHDLGVCEARRALAQALAAFGQALARLLGEAAHGGRGERAGGRGVAASAVAACSRCCSSREAPSKRAEQARDAPGLLGGSGGGKRGRGGTPIVAVVAALVLLLLRPCCQVAR